MDRASINIVSLILGGVGLFAVLGGWYARETTMAFLGSNPFLVKRDAIRDTTDKMFGGLAMLAIAIQVAAEVVGDALPSRTHRSPWYAWLSAIALVVVVLLGLTLNRVCRRLARRVWLGPILQQHAHSFTDAAYVVANNGRRPHQNTDADVTDEQRAHNYADAAKKLAQIEKLLELPQAEPLPDRVARLQVLFAPYQQLPRHEP
jgi:hypothetical protein